jgi:hypothetical protein
MRHQTDELAQAIAELPAIWMNAPPHRYLDDIWITQRHLGVQRPSSFHAPD